VVTLVRNPWDRMVSYYHWLRAQSFSHPAVDLAKRHDFTGFLSDPYLQSSIAAAPYGSYVTDSAGVERCSSFVKLEHLEADLAAFESHLGFRIGPLTVNNTSERTQDYRQYFTNETREIVGRIAADDIRRFDYRY
jgi:hypothetical protein